MRSWMIAAAAGIGSVAFLPFLPSVSWIPFVAIAVALLLYLKLYKTAVFVCGALFSWSWGATLLSGQLPADLEGKDLLAVGRVCSIPSAAGKALRFDFCVDQLLDPKTRLKEFGSIKIKMSWYRDYQLLKPNDAIAMVVRLKRPRGFANPAGFDRESWLIVNGYGATGYVKAPHRWDHWVPMQATALLHGWRGAVIQILREQSPHLQNLASIEALTLGEKGELTQDQWDQLARTGTSHLLVISGMHIGLFSGLTFLLIKLLWLRLPQAPLALRAEVPAGIFAVLCAILYMLMAGAGIPAQRASLMVAIVMASLILLKKFRASTVFCGALLAVLVVDPLAVRSAGLWLSFGAVLAIGLGLSGRLSGWRGSKMLQLVRVQWAVTLLLAPILLHFFGQLSWVSFVVNLVAVPLVTIVIAPCALLGTLLLLVMEQAAMPLLWLADLGLTIFWYLVRIASEQSWAAGEMHSPAWWLLPFLLLAVLMLGPKRLPGQLAGLALVLVWAYPARLEPSNQFLVRVLDVGQGLAVHVQQSDHAMLYDTGAAWSDDFDAGASVVVPNLKVAGLKQLEHVVVSHGDSDHAGGLRSVVSALRPDTISSGEPDRLAEVGFSSEQCTAGQAGKIGAASFEVLWPMSPLKTTPIQEASFVSVAVPIASKTAPTRSGVARNSNDRSCVVRLRYGAWSMLLTGDITATVERELVKTYGIALKSDVLLLPHHGSKTSSSLPFLRRVNPHLAIASTGYRNAFRHPSSLVKERLEKLGIPLLNTAETGSVDLVFTATELKVEVERMRRWGYWQSRAEVENLFKISAQSTEAGQAKPGEASTLSYRH